MHAGKKGTLDNIIMNAIKRGRAEVCEKQEGEGADGQEGVKEGTWRAGRVRHFEVAKRGTQVCALYMKGRGRERGGGAVEKEALAFLGVGST